MVVILHGAPERDLFIPEGHPLREVAEGVPHAHRHPSSVHLAELSQEHGHFLWAMALWCGLSARNPATPGQQGGSVTVELRRRVSERLARRRITAVAARRWIARSGPPKMVGP